MALLKADGAVEAVNRQILEYTGRPLEAVRDWATSDVVHPDDLPHLNDTLGQSIAAGTPFEIVQRMRRFDGEYRWFLNCGRPLRNPHDLVTGWCVLLTDIDERKRAEDVLRERERALKRSEAFLAQAQRLTLTGSLWWDVASGRVIWSDQSYRIMELATSVEPTVELVFSRIHPDDRATVGALVERSAREGANLDLEHRLLMPDGSVKHVHVVLQSVGLDPSRFEFVGALTDITARKLAEVELRHTQDRLMRAGAELARVSRLTTLSALTASIAHEVNQPLSGIITNANTCVRMLDATPPDVTGARETARRTIRDGNRASEVVAKLRQLFSSRELTREPLDLNDAIREVLALSFSELQRNSITLRSDFTEPLPPVDGDRIQLQQVVLNLLRNASDAMTSIHDRPRQIRVVTDLACDRVRVTVRDTGVGIPAQDRESLFDAFYSTKSGGMGIGLFVSRSIVERHDGQIWIEPPDGHGATFAFSIPHRPSAQPTR